MSDRAKALEALAGLRLTAFVIDAAHEKNVVTFRAAIDRTFPPDKDEDIDPVGEAPGWIIKLPNGEE